MTFIKKVSFLLVAVLYGFAAFSQAGHEEVENDVYVAFQYVDSLNNYAPDSGIGKQYFREMKRLFPMVHPHGKFSEVVKGYRSYLENYEYDDGSSISQALNLERGSKKSVSGSPWLPIGPFGDPASRLTGNGRMDRIHFHPQYNINGNKVVFASSPYGGLWRSDNDGQNWIPLTDNLPNSAVAEFYIDENDPLNIYIATGIADHLSIELGPNKNSANYTVNSGMWKSSDGGLNWFPINSAFGKPSLLDFFPFGGCLRDIAKAKANTYMFIATSEGVFRSAVDLSNVQWHQVNTGIVDKDLFAIKINPSNINEVYCSGKDIYKSTDKNGSAWISLTKNYPGLDLTNMAQDFQVERINIEIAPSNHQILYAYIMGNEYCSTTINNELIEGRPKVLYIYKFDGVDWEEVVKVSGATSGCGNYAYEGIVPIRMALTVSPTDENDVYFGNANTYRVNNGVLQKIGSYSFNGHHADVHGLEFEPNTVNANLWCANDGGICKKSSQGTNHWTSKNGDISVSTIWNFDNSLQDKNYVLTGHQDNGTIYSKPGTNSYDWIWRIDGDGYAARINGFNHEDALANSNGTVISFNAINNTTQIESGSEGKTDERDQTRYLPYDPYDNGSMPNKYLAIGFDAVNDPESGAFYVGISEIYKKNKIKSTGPILIPASGAVSTADYQLSSDISKHPRETIGDNLPWIFKRQGKDMDINEDDPNYIYYVTGGTDNLGLNGGFFLVPGLFRSKTGFRDGGYGDLNDVKFHDIVYNLPKTSVNPPGTNISRSVISGVVTDNSNPNRVWVALVSTESRLKIWSSEDAGDTWNNADPLETLPNVPINSICYINGSNDLIVLGTDVGIYFKDRNMKEWKKDMDFPSVRVSEIRAAYNFGVLRVGTFGRGMWELDISSFLNSDLYIRDNIEDGGSENNTSQPDNHMWISSDIWVRHTDDGKEDHVDPSYYEADAVNYVYFRVRNKGLEASPGNEKIELFYTKANSGWDWPDYWNGNKTQNGIKTGDKIGEVKLPVIQPDDVFVGKLAWTLPDPLDYRNGAFTEPNHFCIYARIEEPSKSDNGFFRVEGSSTFANVMNNNNNAQKNVTIVGDSKDFGEKIELTRNPNPNPKGKFNLANGTLSNQNRVDFKAPNNEAGENVMDYGNVKVSLEMNLYDAWVRGGRQSNGMTLGWEPQEVNLTLSDPTGEILGNEIPLVVRVDQLRPTFTLDSTDSYFEGVEMNSNEPYGILTVFEQFKDVKISIPSGSHKDILDSLRDAEFAFQVEKYSKLLAAPAIFDFDVVHSYSDSIQRTVGGEHYIVKSFAVDIEGLTGNSKLSNGSNGHSIKTSAKWFEENFEVWPNPVQNELNIKALVDGSITQISDIKHEYHIFNMEGKQVRYGTFTGSVKVNLFDLPYGSYSIVLSDRINGRIFSANVIKQ